MNKIREESLSLKEVVDLLEKIDEMQKKDYITIENIYNTVNLSKNKWKVIKDDIVIIYALDDSAKASLEINTSEYAYIRRLDEYVVIYIKNYEFSGEGRFKFALLDANNEIKD